MGNSMARYQWEIGDEGLRAKALPLKAIAHVAEQHDTELVSGNGNAASTSHAGIVRSPVRKTSLPEAVKIFDAACNAVGASMVDVATALCLAEGTVSRWFKGTASIPSDCVWALLRRHPPLGEEIVFRCFERLPAKNQASFLRRAAALG